MAKTASATLEKVTLRVPEDLYDSYGERAAKLGKNVDTEMLARLTTCRDHTSTSPIYISDTGRMALSELAGRTLTTEASVLAWAQNVTTIKVAGIDIPLSEQLLKRLSSRTFGKTLSDYLKQAVTEQLEILVGMR